MANPEANKMPWSEQLGIKVGDVVFLNDQNMGYGSLNNTALMADGYDSEKGSEVLEITENGDVKVGFGDNKTRILYSASDLKE